MDPFDEGEKTLIRPDFEPSEDLEREEVERTEEALERSEVEPREEVLFKGMSKSETKSHKWRKGFSQPTNTHFSLAKQSKNAMMSSISPSEEQTGSKAKKSWKSLYDERMVSLQTEGLSSSYDHPDVNFTPCPRNDISRNALSTSPTRPMSDGIILEVLSTFDILMTSMGKQKGGASSSTRLQPQLTSSSLRLAPPLGAAGNISDKFAGVMNGLDDLRRDMTKRIDQADERAHRGRGNLRDELMHVKSQARFDQAQLIRNTDQCLAESLAQANKESEEREARMTREIERLLNDHDNTYAHTMTSLERRLDAKSDLLLRKLDEILNGSNREERSNSRERSRQANDGDGHEETRNLSEPSDQTIMHINVYADYLSALSPQTTSRAVRALFTRGSRKSIRVDDRYTEAYGPHEVILNIDGTNIYTKTMITCDEDRQIYVGIEELKVRSSNLGIGSGPGQPPRGLAGRIQPRREQMQLRRQGCPLCHKSVQCQI